MSSIASRQFKGIENMEKEVNKFLDYCATHPNAGVRFVTSDMMLALHSYASYLSARKSKSKAAGQFLLGKQNIESFNNGAIMTLSKIIKHVMSSYSEAETAAILYHCKAALPLRVSIEEMGHEQFKKPVTTDITAANGLIRKTMIPKRAKYCNMRFNFLKCREVHNQFDLVWRKGKLNKADYHSKRHPNHHYRRKRGDYVVEMPLPKQ